MERFTQFCRQTYSWFKIESEDGAAAIEYALLATLIALAIITAVTLMSTNIGSVFSTLMGKLNPSPNAP